MDKRLETVQRIAARVQEYLAEARVMRSVHERSRSEFQMERFLEGVMEASFCSERLTEELRRLVLENCIGKQKGEAYGLRLAKLHGISVHYEEGIVQAELPFLTPHRKKAYTDYLYKPFLTALENWCVKQREAGGEPPVFETGTVCFVHMYDRSLSKGRIRDHDNLETKQMVDALGMFFLVSDGGLSLDTYHTTVFGDQDRTFLFLMGKERFVQWICGNELEKMVSKKIGH